MRVLLVVAALAATASASPALDVTISDTDFMTAIEPLVPQYDEPIGLAVIANNPLLGLYKGDLVRAINGQAALESMKSRVETPIVYLDVVRGGKVVVVRVAILKDKPIEDHIDRDRFRDQLDLAAKWGAKDMFRPVTKDGKPSGIAIGGWFPPLLDGDIIRKIDGTRVLTPDDALAALQKAADHKEVVFEVDRFDKPLTAKLTIDAGGVDPAVMAKIKKVNDTTWEIGKEVIDAVLSNPMAVAKGARVVPAVKDGKAAGFKLYAIRPSSIYATLGFENGDTLKQVNGVELTTADKALDAYTKLRDAKKLTVEIERRGKPITLTYRIK